VLNVDAHPEPMRSNNSPTQNPEDSLHSLAIIIQMSKIFINSLSNIIHCGLLKTWQQIHGHNLSRFKKITGRFCSKFAVKRLLKIPPHLAYAATLHCETLMPENKQLTTKYKVVHIATYLTCGGVVWQHMQGIVGFLITTFCKFTTGYFHEKKLKNG